ncbi:hypothetical protein HV337_08460 [Citrobacter freundii]|uniref:hypothetical protein n=1 Tax=Citrobacter freundii TaxID=546 RepID=UPI0015E9720F|nr:hypothetical protein [Citrobacter freundii]QLR72576.1 hypothetical protein HV337_08460 [Citrobacter freundii]QLY51797.1 hypothetical protein HV186_08560 [Citrobacter freundii]
MLIRTKQIYYVYCIVMALKLSFYFDGASRYLPLRATIILSFFCLLYLIVNKIKINTHNTALISFYGFFSFLFIFMWGVSGQMSPPEQLKQILEFIFPFLIVFNVWTLTKNINTHDIETGLLFFIYSSLLLICTDTIIRLCWPSYAFKGDETEYLIELSRDTFYIYKYGSIMYLDSNYVALHILLIIGLLLNISCKYKSVLLLSSIILLILTFSRSAYIGFISIVTLYYFIRVHKTTKMALVYIVIVMMIFLGIWINHSTMNDFITDESFSSKIIIFSSLEKIASIDLINLLFGSGFDIGGYIFSYKDGGYAHAFIPLVLGELGVVGLIAMCSVLLLIMIKLRSASLYILAPYMICGFSLIYPYDSMYILVFTSLLVVKSKHRTC